MLVTVDMDWAWSVAVGEDARREALQTLRKYLASSGRTRGTIQVS